LDTFKDKQLLEDLYSRGQVPWEVWKSQTAPPNVERAEGRWMHKVSILERASGPKKILALGAHADDIEIGKWGHNSQIA